MVEDHYLDRADCTAALAPRVTSCFIASSNQEAPMATSAVGSARCQQLRFQSTAAAPRRARCCSGHLQRRVDANSTSNPSGLRLFLQSASIQQWEQWGPTGLFHGFSTNPTTLEKDGVQCDLRSLTQLASTAFGLGAKELHLGSWGDSAAMLRSVAFDLAGIDPQRIVVKLPCTLEGIQTATLLRDVSIRVAITGLYSTSQVLLAQAVGAEYAATYLGRMKDMYGEEQGKESVMQMQKIITAQGCNTRLAVASIREPSELALLAAQGCNTFNIPPKVAIKMFRVQGTLDAAGEFDSAARRKGGYQ